MKYECLTEGGKMPVKNTVIYKCGTVHVGGACPEDYGGSKVCIEAQCSLIKWRYYCLQEYYKSTMC